MNVVTKVRILTLIAILFSANSVFGRSLCLISEAKEKVVFKIDPVQESQVIKTFSTIGQSSFFCTKSNTIYTCSGDDDSGEFKIDLKKLKIMVEHISINPPTRPYRVLKKKDFKGGKLSKIKCKA